MRPRSFAVLLAALALAPATGYANPTPPPPGPAADRRSESMSMIANLALSPDGKRLACVWDGDIWLVPAEGGEAKRLTNHPADDGMPVWSRDGRQIAFSSKRENGVSQVFVMEVAGGTPRQVTFHSEGSIPLSWWGDGKSLLIGGARDHLAQNYKPPFRLFRINLTAHEQEELMFDDYSGGGDVSPDGTRILITREDHEPYRIGYRGSQSGQIWIYDITAKTFTRVLAGETGCRSPKWRADGRGFTFLDSASGVYNVAEHDLVTGKTRILTHHTGVNCYTPAVSADGSTLVYRHGFDLYRIDPRGNGKPQPVTVYNRTDRERDRTVRRTLAKATEVRFSKDGLETLFAAGGDLWVMDTAVAEPHAITRTPEEETNPCLDEAGDTLYFIQNRGATHEVMRATREDTSRYWWQNDRFTLAPVTADKVAKSALTLSPDGNRLAYIRGLGDLVVANRDGSQARVIIAGWSPPDYTWSPDGKWIAYAIDDNDFNRDVYLIPADGSAAPVNLSRHPDQDNAPAWSPDGKCLAWVHHQGESTRELSYVWLTKDRSELTARDRKIEEAVEKMKKERAAPKGKSGQTPAGEPAKTPEPTDKSEEKTEPPSGDKTPAKPAKLPDVAIDLDEIYRRVRHLPIPHSEKFAGLVWTDDSKKVLFVGKTDTKDAMLAVEVTAESPKAELWSATPLANAGWLDKAKCLAGLADGLPATAKAGAAATTVKFAARQEYNRDDRQRIGFLDTWRFMRDTYYDAALNNRDWNAVRTRYEDAAAHAVDTVTFDRVMNMMLGELNGSHHSFRSHKERDTASEWKVVTGHLGVRFDAAHTGPGQRISEIIPDGPADRVRSRLAPGEILLAIDDQPVTPRADLTSLLNGPLERDLRLLVRATDGRERTVSLRPGSYDEIRRLVRADHLRRNSRATEKLSGGKLGYVYIANMNWKSFREFEKAIYEEGSGKQGLVIDVRDNPGGFTTDHLLTLLCQPQHAITVPRDGGPGYPLHERQIFGAWTKPIVVLCNQNSYSNSEVFSHAVKNLGRGKVVGVRTAGGVISTGSTTVFDLGELRTPFRGWYSIRTGEDYELNGAQPDFPLWPEPGEIPAGKDRQLEKAVEVLLRDVAAVPPLPKPINAHANGR